VPHSWQLGQYLDHHPYPKDKPDISEDLVGVIDADLGAFEGTFKATAVGAHDCVFLILTPA
jgi:hypothetical protein